MTIIRHYRTKELSAQLVITRNNPEEASTEISTRKSKAFQIW